MTSLRTDALEPGDEGHQSCAPLPSPPTLDLTLVYSVSAVPQVTDQIPAMPTIRNRFSITLPARTALGAILALAAAAGALPAAAQSVASSAAGSAANSAATAGAAVVPMPIVVGERLEYEVKFGSIRVGSGTMEVRGIEDVRGRPSYHAIFQYGGGIPFYRVNDVHQTWFDTETLSSRRFHQDIDEGNYERTRRFEIYPERGKFTENDKPEEETVNEPLDDASFLYFIRTLPLNVGDTYTLMRYFKPQGNPVVIKVLRKETIKVPAGTFETVVLQPTIRTKGIFSENGRAEVWISNDSRRMVVQMKSKLSFGSLNLYLKSTNIPATMDSSGATGAQER